MRKREKKNNTQRFCEIFHEKNPKKLGGGGGGRGGFFEKNGFFRPEIYGTSEKSFYISERNIKQVRVVGMIFMVVSSSIHSFSELTSPFSIDLNL